MNFRTTTIAALIACLALGGASAAVAQSNDVKGWTPKAPAPVPAAPDPAAGGGDDGPKSITRDEGQPAPAQPAPAPIAPTPQPQPPANDGGPNMEMPVQGGGDVLLANDPVSIQRALQDAGYRAEMSTDDQGNPKIVGTASRSTYWVFFLDCDSASGCLGVEFFVSYELNTPPSLEQLNQFNFDYRYVRAFTNTEGQPRMMMDILMRDGGLDRQMFLEYVRLWHVILPEFEASVGF